MPHTLIEKCCVRTQIKHRDEKVNTGSGVILKDNNQYYVLTAYHCVFGENNEYSQIDINDIWIESQTTYNSPFNRLQAKSICHYDISEDWVLLDIQDPGIDCDFAKIYKGKKFILDQEVRFCGYQECNNDRFRPWSAKVLTSSNNEFVITLTGSTYDQGGESGATLAKGLSGSGVYVIRGHNIYLIGILKSVIGDRALNNDMNCSSLTNLESKLQDGFECLNNIDLIDRYLEILESNLIEENINTWSSSNNTFFDNIYRKEKVLYNDPKAKNVTNTRINDYLETQSLINRLRIDDPKLFDLYQETSNVFVKKVNEFYSGSVTNQNMARDKLLKLEEDFTVQLTDLFKFDNSNSMKMRFARHMVTEWLMNCSFDFID